MSKVPIHFIILVLIKGNKQCARRIWYWYWISLPVFHSSEKYIKMQSSSNYCLSVHKGKRFMCRNFKWEEISGLQKQLLSNKATRKLKHCRRFRPQSRLSASVSISLGRSVFELLIVSTKSLWVFCFFDVKFLPLLTDYYFNCIVSLSLNPCLPSALSKALRRTVSESIQGVSVTRKEEWPLRT